MPLPLLPIQAIRLAIFWVKWQRRIAACERW